MLNICYPIIITINILCADMPDQNSATIFYYKKPVDLISNRYANSANTLFNLYKQGILN
jgi:hypothetical protein